MKKFFAWTLVLVLVLSVFTAFAPASVKADETDPCYPEVSIGDLIDLAQSGTTAGDNSGHGNHQTRVVRTSHGEYVCYISDKNNGNGINEISVIKVDAEAGTAKTVFSELKSYDTSQSCVVVDDDENVWMVFVYDDKLKDQFDGRGIGVHLAAYCIDAKTDDVNGYETLVDVPAPAEGTGYGYSSFYYDSSTNCIYTIGFNGSDKAGDIYWFTFDIDNLLWTGYGDAKVDIRHGYPFMIPDGKGGLYLICQDDYGASAAGYPEIGNNNGLSNDDLERMKTDTNYQTQGSRWSANYCWDELDFYYIPDMTKSDYYETTIVPKDYSRVQGDQEYRYSYEGRMTNAYPNMQMNNGGDMILDKDGNLHVVYYKNFIYAASTRKSQENSVMHDVYDLSDPKNPKLLSSSLLVEMVSEGVDENYWRLYEDTEGNIYYINTTNSYTAQTTMNVYLADGTPSEGYEKVLLATKNFTSGVNINVANMRGNSLIDNTIDVILTMKDSDYDFLQIKINTDTEHDFEDLVIDEQPTCAKKGTAHYVCDICGTSGKTVSIAMLPHTLKPVEAKESTCKEQGNIAHYACEVCGALFEDATGNKPIENPDDVLLPLSDEHVFNDFVVDKEPTCTEKGSGHYVCDVCGKEGDPIDIAEVPHTLKLVEGKESTCKEQGNIPYYVCEECDQMFEDATGNKPITNPEDVLLPLSTEHQWGDWEITVEPTPEADGVKVRTCKICGATEDAPASYIPETGAPNVILWTVLMALAIVLAGAAVIVSKKKKRA